MSGGASEVREVGAGFGAGSRAAGRRAEGEPGGRDGRREDDVPEGYKRTEVGVIPEDWEVKALKVLSQFITKGTTPTTYGFQWQRDGITFLRSECVSDTGLNLDESVFISAAAHSFMERSQVSDGDILMTITGNVGRVIYLTGIGVANINQHIARVHLSSPTVHSEFVFHYLSQPQVQRQFEKITTGQAYPQISLEQVRDALVPIPARREQCAIAEALSDADRLIESLDKLIAKKRAVKQAAMQQLLTGKTRLPGFEADWTLRSLGSVLTFQVGFPFESRFFNSEGRGVRLVRNGDLKGGGEATYYDGTLDPAFEIEDGDILIGMDGDFVLHLWLSGRALLNQRVGRICGSNDADARFAYYRLAWPLKEIERSTSGTTVKHLAHSDIAKIKIPLPDVREQTAIATVLSDMDAEIAALEKRRDKAKAVKQGMMQELLTGRVRLVEPETRRAG